MPTVQGIVAQSGGFIEVESKPGTGSRVHVHFPAVVAAPDPEPRPRTTGEGRELAARARKEGCRVPFVFMSGYDEEEIMRDPADSNPLEILEKPFTPDELARAVSKGVQSDDPGSQYSS